MVTIDDVEMHSSTGWSQLPDANKTHLLEQAEREVTDLYSGRVSTLAEIEGNKDDLVELVTAHKWELAEGGEAQSESATGGSVNYNTVTGEIPNSWSETRFGRQALEYIRDSQGISMVTTR